MQSHFGHRYSQRIQYIMDRLLITVKEIKGLCPVYRVGDRIILDEGYRLNLEETNTLAMQLSHMVEQYKLG